MTETLATLAGVSKELADVVATAARSVVTVSGRRRMAASGVLWDADGIVVTACHVIETDAGVRVGLPDSRILEAALVGRDPSTDLAVLRIAEVGLAAASWATHQDLQVGQLVVCVARPAGAVQAAMGVLSAVEGPWRTASGGAVDAFLRADVVMYPGFSGGALVDTAGQVLGLATSGLGTGAGLGLPAATVKRVVAALLEHGRIRRGYLGITVQPARLSPTAGGAERRQGLLVTSVEPGSPAEAAGILVGDVLLALDDRRLASLDDLVDSLSGDRVDRAVTLSLIRGGQEAEAKATVGERPR
jgi:S1-C subfamily serine protease